jgi:hypothetical protein
VFPCDTIAGRIDNCAPRENSMDTGKTTVQFCIMWRLFIAFLLSITPALAQENATAYDALRVVGTQLGRGALNHVVSVTGDEGDPQPKKWKVILENPVGAVACTKFRSLMDALFPIGRQAAQLRVPQRGHRSTRRV